jgi:hypothetical protein
MLDEKSLSLKGRRCDNYEDVTTKNPNKYTQKGLQLLFLAWFILITIMLIFKHC